MVVAVAEGDVDDGCSRPMLAYGAAEAAVDPKPLVEEGALERRSENIPCKKPIFSKEVECERPFFWALILNLLQMAVN